MIQIGDHVIYHWNHINSTPQHGIIIAQDKDLEFYQTINQESGKINYVADKHIHAVNGQIRKGHESSYMLKKDHPVYVSLLKL